MEIRNRWNDKVIHTIEGNSLCDANLRGADLRGANLYGANLCGANLSGADGDEKLTLIGLRPLFSTGPIGSRSDYLWAYLTDRGIWVRAGCFWGNLEEFAEAVTGTHGDSGHAIEYRAAIELIKKHAEIWSPKEESSGSGK